jgi:B9 domain-containing protein 1
VSKVFSAQNQLHLKNIMDRSSRPGTAASRPASAFSQVQMQPPSNYFILIVNGIIAHAEFPGSPKLTCNYRFVYGQDWEVVRITGENASLLSGMTQVAERAPGPRPIFTWNFPVEIIFRSTNPYGWPKLVMTVSESKGKGKFPIVGYGWCHVPVNPGRYQNTVRLFKPRHSSTIQSLLSMVTGKQPELINITTACSGEGREVMRTQSEGAVKVMFDIVTKDMSQFGFERPADKNYKHTQIHLGLTAANDEDALNPEYSSLAEHPLSRQLY